MDSRVLNPLPVRLHVREVFSEGPVVANLNLRGLTMTEVKIFVHSIWPGYMLVCIAANGEGRVTTRLCSLVKC